MVTLAKRVVSLLSYTSGLLSPSLLLLPPTMFNVGVGGSCNTVCICMGIHTIEIFSDNLSLSLSLSPFFFFQAFIQLFSSIPQPPDTLVVEYFLDKEKAHLFFNETKPLTVSQ